MFFPLYPLTYFIRSFPDHSDRVTWKGDLSSVSKYADERVRRAKARYAKRRSKR